MFLYIGSSGMDLRWIGPWSFGHFVLSRKVVLITLSDTEGAEESLKYD